MARTTLLYLPCGALVVAGWLSLEKPAVGTGRAMLLVGVALVPVLASPRWLRVCAGIGAALAACWIALGVSFVRSPQDFFGPAASRFWTGVLAFYRVTVPFDPGRNPHMQEALLVGVFAFCLLLGIAIGARRPLAAGLVLVFGAAWPIMILPGHAALFRGALILGACLLLLAGMSERPRLAPALVLAALVLAGALAAAASPAVAKRELVHWQGWSVGSANRSVSVDFVWNSSYSGLNWPDQETTVLKIQAPPVARYWRATTLDTFRGGRWLENLSPAASTARSLNGLDELSTARSLPVRARKPRRWIRQTVTVEHLRDRHLIAASVPVAVSHPGLPYVNYFRGGVAVAQEDPAPDTRYMVWSYAARPSAKALAASPPRYPDGIRQDDLSIWPGVIAPPFGASSRGADLRYLAGPGGVPRVYLRLYRAARDVVGRARTPYAAALALEWWFREAGDFRYDEHPPVARGVPPLVAFLQTKRGYCQHFAGAMALMLRYLGVPARVGVGFTSGSYDSANRTWTVTDHDAHAWVEAWFRGYGWLPFDPTPGRGTLGASYTSASPSFLASLAAAAVAGAPKKLFERSAKAKTPILIRPRRPLPGDPVIAVTPPPAHEGSSILGLITLLLAGLLTGVVLFKRLRMRLRYLNRDSRRIASACRQELVEYLADQGLELPSNATLTELARLVRHELGVSAEPFAAAAARARFGSPGEAAHAAALARHELRVLRLDMNKRLSPVDRLRGAFSLRFLRVA